MDKPIIRDNVDFSPITEHLAKKGVEIWLYQAQKLPIDEISANVGTLEGHIRTFPGRRSVQSVEDTMEWINQLAYAQDLDSAKDTPEKISSA
jgi:hypothetical protein